MKFLKKFMDIMVSFVTKIMLALFFPILAHCNGMFIGFRLSENLTVNLFRLGGSLSC